MRISDEELAHLEKLARIELRDEERAELRDDLSRILDYFDNISELDTEGVPELVRPLPLANVAREDLVRPSLARERVLELAVESEDGYFKVPRMIDGND